MKEDGLNAGVYSKLSLEEMSYIELLHFLFLVFEAGTGQA